MRLFPFIVAAVLAVFSAAADAAEFRVDLPVDCAVGRDCVIQNYFDHDDGDAVLDYACGDLSFDGHRDTDFRVADLPAMTRGVAVVAAAPGVVTLVHDGEPDIDARKVDADSLAGREAGNAVVIDHGGGWQTQYSHLRQGSVAVAVGDAVEAGDRLGEIGMSGRATFPHVEFSLRLEGQPVDPFTGPGVPVYCGVGDSPLWTVAALSGLEYRPTGLLAAGFTTREPRWEAARRGDYQADRLYAEAPALVFWVSLYGVRVGDFEIARLIAPDGAVVAERFDERDDDNAQWFSYVGRKRDGEPWPPGVYRGVYRLLRGPYDDRRAIVSVVREIEVR